jgi:PAS domain S-box-containing protein
METAEHQASTLRKERDVLRALLADTDAQLAYLDPQFNFVAVNAAYAKGSGHTQEELIGRNHFELFPDAENQAIFEQVAATGKAAEFRAKPFTYPQRPELGVTYWDWTLTPDKDYQGHVRGLVLSLTDVTERERGRRRDAAHMVQLETLVTLLQQVLSAATPEEVYQAAVHGACQLTQARLAISGHSFNDCSFRVAAVSCTDGTAPCRPGETLTMQRGAVDLEVLTKKTPLRLTQEQLLKYPGWWGLPDGHAPLRGLLCAALLDRDGRATGLIMVTDKKEGDFTAEDEALLRQLAALISLGLQHLEARNSAQRRAAELQATTNAIPDGIMICDIEGRLIQANTVALGILNLSTDDVELPITARVSRLSLAGPSSEPLTVDQLPISRALRGETVRDAIVTIQPQGKERRSWLHVSAAPIRGDDGGALGAVLSFSDITSLHDTQQRLEAANEKLLRQSRELLRNYDDLRRLTDALQAERSRLQAVVENAPVGIVLADSESRIVMANPAAEQLYGRPLPLGERLESQRQLTQSNPDGIPYDPRNLPLARAALDGERCVAVDVAVDWPDGQRRLLRTDTAPIRDGKGRLLGAIGVLSDETERRRVAAAMGRYAQRLETLHRADEAILAGRSAEEVAEATLPYVQQLVPCRRISVSLYDLTAGRAWLLAVATSGETQMPKGWSAPLSDTGWPGELAQGKIRLIEDLSMLSPRPRFEETLLAEGIRSWINVPLVVEGKLIGALDLGMDRPGPVAPEQIQVLHEMANELAVGLQEARLRDEVEHHARDLEARVAERTAELQASQARLQTIFDHAPSGIALLNQEGQILESNAALEQLLGYQREELLGLPLARLIHPEDGGNGLGSQAEWGEAKGNGYRRTLRMLRKDNELRQVNLSLSTLQPTIKGGGRTIAIFEDITEAMRTQEGLIQSEKLTMAGRLAASLAHEINNPLQSVIGCLSLVEEANAEGGDISRYLHVAREELRRAAGIVRRLRDVYTPSKPEDRRATDINELLEAVLTLTQKRCEDSAVEVAWKPGKNLPLVRLVPGSIQQVFLNLVLNAVEAMPQGGLLRVSSVSTKRPTGVRVTINDSGGGIPAEALPHLFQPFHTSKSEGLGLGLYVTQKIVDEHGGRINVKSQAGVGSTFQVWLPR